MPCQMMGASLSDEVPQFLAINSMKRFVGPCKAACNRLETYLGGSSTVQRLLSRPMAQSYSATDQSRANTTILMSDTPSSGTNCTECETLRKFSSMASHLARRSLVGR